MKKQIEKREVCPKCKKEIVGVKYYIRETKEWICLKCYIFEK